MFGLSPSHPDQAQAQPAVTLTNGDLNQHALSIERTLLYPGNACNIQMGNQLKVCILHNITPASITVTVETNPGRFVDKDISRFDYSLLSVIAHPMIGQQQLSPGSYVCVKYESPGEKYYGIVVHVEPNARGVHVQFEDGQVTKFTKETFSDESRNNGSWYFVVPFVMLCQEYEETTSKNIQMVGDFAHMDNMSSSMDEEDIDDIFSEVESAITKRPDRYTYDFDLLWLNQNNIDKVIASQSHF
tara:strand:- start:886 stop:1617 length:732 start_codon:yes stop_codon:yes gene_type:complete